MADAPHRHPGRTSVWLALALVLAGAAIAIELLALSGQLAGRWGGIGGGLIILALALSVIGRAGARSASPTSADTAVTTTSVDPAGGDRRSGSR